MITEDYVNVLIEDYIRANLRINVKSGNGKIYVQLTLNEKELSVDCIEHADIVNISEYSLD